MDDIVVRLRKWSISTHAVPASDIMDEAADEIERLRRIIAMWVDCAFKTKDLYGDVFVPRASTYDGGVNRIVSGEWSDPKVSTGRTGNQWFTIPEPPGGTVTEPIPKERRAEVSDTNHDAAPAAKANAESVVPQPTAGDRSGNPTSHSGTGDSLSSAEIDALQHVVEDGRIVKMQDYGALRSLLVRLRPEWEGEDQEPERTHGVRHTQSECTKQDEGIVPDSRNANEPVAWLVNGAEYDTGCEYEYVTLMKEKAEIAAENGGNMIPLFGGPHTWQEEVAAVEDAFERSGAKPTWHDDEPGNIGPMAAAMANEIARLRLTDAEREAVEAAYHQAIASEVTGIANILRGLLERTK